MARYKPTLIKEFVAELEKVPMIRNVCAKVGIDHSTIYRWMARDPDFYSKVTLAQSIGRKSVTDAAENVILHGIQNHDRKAAEFWLRNNEQRYMSSRKGNYYGALMAYILKKMQDHAADKTQVTFEDLFKEYLTLEQDRYEPEFRDHLMEPLIALLCDNDPDLMKAFKSAYEAWKVDRAETEKNLNKIDPDGLIRKKVDENEGKK